jgi:hypothetical protein
MRSRTEDRLADALAAVARGIREETLPPLRDRGAVRRRPVRRRWARRLAPAAAAAGVTLVVVLVSAVHLFAGKPPGGGSPGKPPDGSARPAGPPRYYVSAASTDIQVRSTVTGAVTASIPNPFSGPGSLGMFAVDVAAGDGGREFVAEYTGSPPHGSRVQTRLYEFSLTGGGRVTGLSLINGGLLSGLQGGPALALSPDGSKAAVAVYRPVHFGQPDVLQIAVINLRTGARGYWAGGLARPGFHPSIPSISWGPGGDSLVFLTQWCRTVEPTGFCGPGTPYGQVRTLRVAGGGGRLSSGRVLTGSPTASASTVQALLTPDGEALDLVTLTGSYRGKPHPVPQILLLTRVPLRRGGRARVLYRGVTGPDGVVFLSSDASGRYLLLTWRRNGWIDHGRLRPLAAQRGAFTGAW